MNLFDMFFYILNWKMFSTIVAFKGGAHTMAINYYYITIGNEWLSLVFIGFKTQIINMTLSYYMLQNGKT